MHIREDWPIYDSYQKILTMNPQEIDRLFASHTDTQICIAWSAALDKLIEIHGDFIIDDWPDTWRTAWFVITYLGLWEGDGIAALWQSDQDHIEIFIECLDRIGASSTSSFVSRSFDEVGRDNVLSEKYCYGEVFRQLADDWDQNLSFYTSGITEKLAAYLRQNRSEVKNISGAFAARLEG